MGTTDHTEQDLRDTGTESDVGLSFGRIISGENPCSESGCKEEQQMISYGSYVPAEYGRMGNLEVTNCDIKLGRYP